MLGKFMEAVMTSKKTRDSIADSISRYQDSADGAGSAPLAGDEPAAAAEGTTPSNTVPDNSIPTGGLTPLRWGVDSLYLSYQGNLFPEVHSRLKTLKQLAQSPEPHLQSEAQYPLADHLFEVRDKGAPMFPYILEDGAFRIQLSNPNKTIPMAYVKVSSGCLASALPLEIEFQLRHILQQLGTLEDAAAVSRIDLFVDFASLDDMEWQRQAWVTRAGAVSSYAQEGEFTGWAIGQGGPISARLYNKTVEIKRSGKLYLLELWQQAGWHIGDPVWRLEFQFKREILVQLGLGKLTEVMEHLNGLWSYAMTEWLKLTIPNPNDQTRSRWPVHPLWLNLSEVDWQGDGGPLLRTFRPTRTPNEERLLAMAASALISFMARRGIVDHAQGETAFLYAIYEHLSNRAFWNDVPLGQYLAEKVAEKARQFNTRLNNPEREAEQKRDELAAQTRAYRKASEG